MSHNQSVVATWPSPQSHIHSLFDSHLSPYSLEFMKESKWYWLFFPEHKTFSRIDKGPDIQHRVIQANNTFGTPGRCVSTVTNIGEWMLSTQRGRKDTMRRGIPQTRAQSQSALELALEKSRLDIPFLDRRKRGRVYAHRAWLHWIGGHIRSSPRLRNHQQKWFWNQPQ